MENDTLLVENETHLQTERDQHLHLENSCKSTSPKDSVDHERSAVEPKNLRVGRVVDSGHLIEDSSKISVHPQMCQLSVT